MAMSSFKKNTHKQALWALAAIAVCATSLQVTNIWASGIFHDGQGMLDIGALQTAVQPASGATVHSTFDGTESNDAPLANGPAPLYWRDGTTTYRAVHFLSEWNAAQNTWERISPDLTQASIPEAAGFGVDGITAVSSQGHVRYVGTLAGSLSVNTNGDWVDCSLGLPARTVSALAICRDNLLGQHAVVGFAGYGTATPDLPGRVYQTFDAGRHWQDISGNLPDAPVQSIHFIEANRLSTPVVQIDNQWYILRGNSTSWSPWTDH